MLNSIDADTLSLIVTGMFLLGIVVGILLYRIVKEG